MPLLELVCAIAGAPQLAVAELEKSPNPPVVLGYVGLEVAVVVCAGFGAGLESKKLPPLRAEGRRGAEVVGAGTERCWVGGLAREEKLEELVPWTVGAPPKLSPVNASFMPPKLEVDGDVVLACGCGAAAAGAALAYRDRMDCFRSCRGGPLEVGPAAAL